MSHPDVIGHYIAPSSFEFSVASENGRLLLVQPAIPDEFHPVLEWSGTNQLRVVSGPVAGSTFDLDVKDGVVVGGMMFGALPVSRTDVPPQPTPGEGLVAPEYGYDPVRDAVFEALWRSHERGGEVVVPQLYQVHEFVRWLMDRDEFIFHGSKKTDITTFEPRRTSLELMNYAGQGNLGAVYGTHNGLWAMFFAVVDRARLWGSIRNGFGTYTSLTTGEEVELYHFSVSDTSLADHPFSPGALYVLPRATFERIRRGEDGPDTNEWGSTSPVEPIAVLMLEPADFPFLDRVGGHDDGELITLQKSTAEVYGNVEAAVRLEDGFRISLSEDLDRDVLDSWLETGRKFFPDMTREEVAERTVEIRGPDALIHTLEDRLAEHLRE